VKKFNKYFFKEAETTPLESIKKRKILTEFFEKLFDIYDHIEVSKFYDNYLIESDRLIYIYILKYLYELLKNVFDLIENFLKDNEDYIKVKSMDYYLSDLKLKEAKMNIEQLQEDIKNAVAEGCTDDSEKIIRIKSMLETQKSDIYKFNFMEDLFNDAKNIAPKLDARILFGKELFNLLDMVKNVNRNLSAVFPEYLNKLNEFEKEIDAVLNEINKLKSKKLISPGEFFEVNQYAENSKKKVIDLMANTIFMEHLRNMIDVFDKIVLYEEYIEESISQENISGVGESNELIEEINPLEKFFKKYHEELTAVPSTDSLNKFMDSFNFWLKDEILPITYNKAEEVLLKLVFKEIKNDFLSELALPKENIN
jgi:hypothetical protein